MKSQLDGDQNKTLLTKKMLLWLLLKYVFTIFTIAISGATGLEKQRCKRARFPLNFCYKMSTNFLKISFFIFESLKTTKNKEFESYKLCSQCQ